MNKSAMDDVPLEYLVNKACRDAMMREWRRWLYADRIEVPCKTTTGTTNFDAWLSSPPPPAYRIGDTIVCPGYHSSQGATMASPCTCELCRPQSASPFFSDPSK